MNARMTLYFDGGARPDAGQNAPGRMEIAVVAHGQTYIRDDVGQGDSCTAEWLALRYAVEIAHAAGARHVSNRRWARGAAAARNCNRILPPTGRRSPASHASTSGMSAGRRISPVRRSHGGIRADRTRSFSQLRKLRCSHALSPVIMQTGVSS
jgi:hypothetical protein